MPDEYMKSMPVVDTDQHRGRLHQCPVCGARRWSVWGHARKHWEKCGAPQQTVAVDRLKEKDA